MSLRVAVASSSRLPAHAAPSLPSLSSRSVGRVSSHLLHSTRPTLRDFKPKVYAPIYNPVVDNPLATPPKWSPLSQRCGVIGIKKGMTSIWDANGKHVPVTIVQVKECQVLTVGKFHPGKNGVSDYHAITVGSVNRRRYEINPVVRQRLGLAPTKKRLEYAKTTKALIGHYKQMGLPPKQKVVVFKVSPDALLPVGAEFSVAHFVPGQKVDIRGTSTGKGTAGVMKRHNYSGGTISHGNSKAHRSAGSMGQNQDPGRVFPGKKAPGHMGDQSATIQNSTVQRIDTTLNLLFLRGAVPGGVGNFVKITDAFYGVQRAGMVGLRKGKDQSEVLKNVRELPFPMGDMKLAASLPVVVDAAADKVISGRLGL